MNNVTGTNSVYTILVNDDNSMTITQKRRIMQRSKLMDDLWFVVAPFYNGYDMTRFTAYLEYILPISREYHTEILTLSPDTYNGHLKYQLPFDTNLTSEAGDIELQISFVSVDINSNGDAVQHVRKVTGASITIVPIDAWSNIIPDSALTALDQRIIKMDAQIQALNETSEYINRAKADDISYNRDTNVLQLTSDGHPVGKKVVLKSVDMDPDGMVVVDFSNYDSDLDEDQSNENDVVEF